MKYIFILLWGLLFPLGLFADTDNDTTTVSLNYELGFEDSDGGVLGEHHAPFLFPSLSYCNGEFFIQNRYPIETLQVIIRDDEDTIIYNNVFLLVSNLSFTVSDFVNENKYKIELLYNGHHLYGYF